MVNIGKEVVTGPSDLMKKFVDVGGSTVASLGNNIEKSIANVSTSAKDAVTGLGSSFAFPLAIVAGGLGALFLLK